MGGYTSEFEISLKSGAVVAAHLDPDKYEVYPIVITKNRWTYTTDYGAVYAIQKENFSLELPHKKVLFDGVFNAIHGSPGEDGKIQAYLEHRNVFVLVLLEITYDHPDYMFRSTHHHKYCNQDLLHIELCS